MTAAELVDTLTGNSFTATEVTAAIVAATTVVQGYREETYVFGTDNNVDSALAQIAATILFQGRAAKQSIIKKEKYIPAPLISDSIAALLMEDRNDTFISISNTAPSTSLHWSS